MFSNNNSKKENFENRLEFHYTRVKNQSCHENSTLLLGSKRDRLFTILANQKINNNVDIGIR